MGYGDDGCGGGGGGGGSSGGQREPTKEKKALVLPSVLRPSETEGLVSPLPTGRGYVGEFLSFG